MRTSPCSSPTSSGSPPTAICYPPEEVVANLDRLASTFEEIAAQHGLEKIKTIGDGFMATAGLLVPHADPVMASVVRAVDHREAARDCRCPGRSASASTSARWSRASSGGRSSASTSGATR